MSRDDAILVVRTLNPARNNGGPMYLYRVVWASAPENYENQDHFTRYVPRQPATTNRAQALTMAHNMNRRLHTEYGVIEASHDMEY